VDGIWYKPNDAVVVLDASIGKYSAKYLYLSNDEVMKHSRRKFFFEFRVYSHYFSFVLTCLMKSLSIDLAPEDRWLKDPLALESVQEPQAVYAAQIMKPTLPKKGEMRLYCRKKKTKKRLKNK